MTPRSSRSFRSAPAAKARPARQNHAADIIVFGEGCGLWGESHEQVAGEGIELRRLVQREANDVLGRAIDQNGLRHAPRTRRLSAVMDPTCLGPVWGQAPSCRER